MRALGDHDDGLATLTRLWLLQRPVPRPALERGLPGLVSILIQAGILDGDSDQIRALIDIRPYASDDGAGGWIVSDLTPNLDTETFPVRPDFVLGVSSASSTLAQRPCGHRSVAHLILEPAVGSRACTWPAMPSRWSPPISILGRWPWPR